MKRYDAMHDNDYVSTDRRESPTGQYVLASDVTDLERRYRKAVELLNAAQPHIDVGTGVYEDIAEFLTEGEKA